MRKINNFKMIRTHLKLCVFCLSIVHNLKDIQLIREVVCKGYICLYHKISFTPLKFDKIKIH